MLSRDTHDAIACVLNLAEGDEGGVDRVLEGRHERGLIRALIGIAAVLADEWEQATGRDPSEVLRDIALGSIAVEEMPDAPNGTERFVELLRTR